MREELLPLWDAIERQELPPHFEALFSYLWNSEEARFQAQETYVLDFKDKLPEKFSDSYGAGIIRLALAFHNTIGGIILFGVNDRTLDICGVSSNFEIEFFNRALSDSTGVSIECLTKLYHVPGINLQVAAVLVPRRRLSRPVKLVRQVYKYQPGMLWIRDRHECIEAKSSNFNLLYSDRSLLTFETRSNSGRIQRFLPPPPSTIKNFIGRESLMEALWEWLIFGDSPRLYLSGPGGSGKTTLAFEFARAIAETAGDVRFPNSEKLDCVIFLSAKETEFNPISKREQKFMLCDFLNSEEQLKAILVHSGLVSMSDVISMGSENINYLIDELFDNFNMLIVLDDIDSLSRRRVDTGEEFLFLRIAKSKRRVKILYTVRYPATYALQNCIPVPGLKEDKEVGVFIEECCKQFGVNNPSKGELDNIYTATDGLPLIIETIVGIRKFASTYDIAISQYNTKGGAQARSYLYQREYDALHKDGKSRYVLASLYLLEDPVSTDTISSVLYENSADQIVDAVTECSAIFLTTVDVVESGETLYQLSPPAAPFIGQVSKTLPFFGTLKRKIEHFRTQGSHATPAEAAMISKLDGMLLVSDYQGIIDQDHRLSRDDQLLANPKVRALFGRAYSSMDDKYMELAREHFRAAESSNLRDIQMMRNWYHMEIKSRYNLPEAERICRKVLSFRDISLRYRSEFLSKLGYCHLFISTSFKLTDTEKCILELNKSIDAYLEAIDVGKMVPRGIDIRENIGWLERPINAYFNVAGRNVDVIFGLLEYIVDRKKEVHIDVIDMILEYTLRFPAPKNADGRDRIKLLCSRIAGKARKNMRALKEPSGLEMLAERLDVLRGELERA